jgi:hypothetical protein
LRPKTLQKLAKPLSVAIVVTPVMNGSRTTAENALQGLREYRTWEGRLSGNLFFERRGLADILGGTANSEIGRLSASCYSGPRSRPLAGFAEKLVNV